MKRLSFILTLLCLSVTVIHAQRFWPVTCSESGLKGKVHEVVTMTFFPEDSTGLGLKMVVQTPLYSPEGLLTHQFESNPGSDLCENGKLEFEPSKNLFTHDIFFPSCPDTTLLGSEVVEFDEVGNWIFRKRDKHAQTRHIVYWE